MDVQSCKEYGISPCPSTTFTCDQGSITGAYSSITDKVVPSFVLLAVQDRKVTCYVYELINNEVEVTKTEFEKPPETLPSANSSLMESLLT